jgi:hypothetical protein
MALADAGRAGVAAGASAPPSPRLADESSSPSSSIVLWECSFGASSGASSGKKEKRRKKWKKEEKIKKSTNSNFGFHIGLSQRTLFVH